MWQPVMRLALAATLLLPLAGCGSMGQMATGVDEALYEIVLTHPVTGRPMVGLISEEVEIKMARTTWERLSAAAKQRGVEVDPPGDRLDQVQRVFGDVVAVAHRPSLPWEIHLLRDPLVNAVTPGGGMVFVFEGIFTDYPGGRGFLVPADDDLAAVLAHEIAHVAMMHMAERKTAKLFTDRHEKDPYYSAAYSTAHEADADKLGVLYMALAGYDPMAAPRVWQVAHKRYGSDPGRYLYDHPLHAERVRATAEAAAEVVQFYARGEQNPKWAEILHENPLFPRAVATGRTPGAGILKAIGAAVEIIGQDRAAKKEAKARETAARASPDAQAQLVRLVEAKLDAQGRPLLWMRFENGSQHEVAAVGVTVSYLGQGGVVAQDPNCGGPARIPAGETIWLTCQYYAVPGAGGWSAEITGGPVPLTSSQGSGPA